MTIDKIMNDASAWFDQALKRRIFDKVDETTLKFPEEMRERRIAELAARVAVLSERQEEAAARYKRVIAMEQTELDSLKNQKPITPSPNPTRPSADMAKQKKSARKKKP